MALLQKIPLIEQTTDQSLTVELDGNPYILRVLWNERYGYFSLSVNTIDDEPILTNIKMVNNTPLTWRYRRLPLAGDFFFVHKSGKTYRPTYDDVGGEYGLYYYDPEDALDLPVPAVPRGSTQSIWDSGNAIWDGGASNWV